MLNQPIMVRACWALFSSACLVLLFGSYFIRLLIYFEVKQTIRLSHHQDKKGTPSMGGVLLLLVLGLSTLYWGDASGFL